MISLQTLCGAFKNVIIDFYTIKLTTLTGTLQHSFRNITKINE